MILRLKCVFPECQTQWSCDSTTSNEEVVQVRTDQGWRYVCGAETSIGPSWGWACPHDDQHFEYRSTE